METAALLTWLGSASLGGILVLCYVFRRGYVDAIDATRVHHVGRLPGGRPERDAPAITGGLVGAHVLVGLLGLVVLVLWLANEDNHDWRLGAWAAFSFAVVAAGIGVTMFGSWRRQENRGSRAVDVLPAPAMYLHALAALATVTLLLLTALAN